MARVFYWLAVCATFALGTAAGDWSASLFRLGYLGSAVLSAVIMLIPAKLLLGTRRHAVLCLLLAAIVIYLNRRKPDVATRLAPMATSS